jgi:hypothetical protein
MPRTRLLPFLAAILLVLVGATSAHAGQYTLAYDFGSDLSGWSGYVEPSYLLCGHGSPAGCPDIATNRILARAGTSQPLWSQGRWEWTAPPGTTIAGGALAYRTRMRHTAFYARVKTRSDGVDWDLAPALVSEQQTTALTDHVLALAAGFRQIGVSLYAHPAVAGLVTDPWDDYVTLVRLDVTVTDPTPPSIAWGDGGALLDGAWHRGDVCARVGVSDGQSGINSLWLESGGAFSSWLAPRSGSQYQPGIAGAQADLCLSAAALGDGVHAGTVGGDDVSGGRAAPLSFTVAIDATPPAAALTSPAAVATDSRPVVRLDLGDATSGISSVLAQIDGTAVPLDLAGGHAVGRPLAALAYGSHTVAYTVLDAAGNRTDGSAVFSVPDTAPPDFGAPEPANGATIGSDAVLAVSVAVTDGGSGVDPGSIALTLDAAPVEHVWQADSVVHGVATGRLPAGVHHLALQVADRAGNVAHLAWGMAVASGPGSAGSVPAGGAVPAGAGPGPAPGSPGAVARRRGVTVRAVVARVAASRPRVVVVRLRSKPRLRIVLRLQCGKAQRTLHVRASKRGIAVMRVACAGIATVRMVAKPGRLLVHIAARRLPLRLAVQPQRRTAPSVARVSGQLAEIHGRTVVLEALTAAGWRRVGLAHADAAGRFSTSFAIVHAGQFALRGRVPALAAVASMPFVLTMR